MWIPGPPYINMPLETHDHTCPRGHFGAFLYDRWFPEDPLRDTFISANIVPRFLSD